MSAKTAVRPVAVMARRPGQVRCDMGSESYHGWTGYSRREGGTGKEERPPQGACPDRNDDSGSGAPGSFHMIMRAAQDCKKKQ